MSLMKGHKILSPRQARFLKELIYMDCSPNSSLEDKLHNFDENLWNFAFYIKQDYNVRDTFTYTEDQADKLNTFIEKYKDIILKEWKKRK